MDNSKKSVVEAIAEVYLEEEQKRYDAILKELWKLTMQDALRDGLISAKQYERYKNIEFKEGD